MCTGVDWFRAQATDTSGTTSKSNLPKPAVCGVTAVIGKKGCF